MDPLQTDSPDAGSDWLEQALRADGREYRSTYLADDGFGAAVLARLPEPPTLPAWRRPVIILLWLCAGVATVLAVPALFDDVFRGVVAMLVGHRMGLADVAALLTLLGAATWGTLVYAARSD